MSSVLSASRSVIVTADDFGLSDETNRGIITAHRRGVLRSASLMLNGPSTASAIQLAKATPTLELGIHLGIVEGWSLLGRRTTLTDDLSYFAGGPCLHRGWPRFAGRFMTGRIDLGELEAELDLQLARMANDVGAIAFANGTQHLHLLPGLLEMVLRLLTKYRVPALRLPAVNLRTPGLNRRRGASGIMAALGRRGAAKAKAAGLVFPDAFAGFDLCGYGTTEAWGRLLAMAPPGVTELMTHPGEDAPHLRRALPWAYQDFDWAGELRALTDPGLKAALERQQIALAQFADLPRSRGGGGHS